MQNAPASSSSIPQDAGHAVTTGGLPDHLRFRAMLSVMLAVAMASLDTAIANTALPTFAAALGTTAADSIWIVNAYQLTMVAAVLPLASLGEIAGHKRVCLAGLILFTLASAACGFAWSLPSLVVFRGLQGLGGAAMMAVNGAMIRFIAPPDRLGAALGINAMVVGSCFVIGPTVTSLVLAIAPWPWLFLFKLPICVLALYVGWTSLPNTARAAHRFDGPASVLCALLFGSLVLGLGEISHAAPWPRVTAEWTITLACLVWLLRRQAAHPAPMLAIDLFRRPLFALSSLTSVCAFATQGFAFVALPFMFQQRLGRSAVEIGLLITPWPVVVAALAPIAGRLSDRYPAGLLGGIGLAVLASGMALMATMPAAPSDWDIVWRMVWCGIGFGFFQSPNLNALMTSAPAHRSGAASGIIATSRLTGQATGTALVAACFLLTPDHGDIAAMWLGAVFSCIGCVASFARLRVRPGPMG
ncbi:MAG: MFS transporter [Burkholderiaceae bacterium]